jgi:hypothetical protein
METTCQPLHNHSKNSHVAEHLDQTTCSSVSIEIEEPSLQVPKNTFLVSEPSTTYHQDQEEGQVKCELPHENDPQVPSSHDAQACVQGQQQLDKSPQYLSGVDLDSTKETIDSIIFKDDEKSSWKPGLGWKIIIILTIMAALTSVILVAKQFHSKNHSKTDGYGPLHPPNQDPSPSHPTVGLNKTSSPTPDPSYKIDDKLINFTSAPSTLVPSASLPISKAPIQPVVQANSTVSCPQYPTPPPLPGKKGAAFLFRPQDAAEGSWVENLPKVLDLNVSWNHNWDLHRIEAQPSGIEFTPMLWGGKRDNETIAALLQEEVISNFQTGQVLRLHGFNEPDKADQSNISVARALELWPLLESIGIPLVSPSCAEPEGQWMQEFMSNATADCKRVDWVGVHWYGGASFESFASSMQSIYESYGKPIIITEFAPADWQAKTLNENRHSPSAVLSFMKLAIPWLEEQDWVMGYAWFPFQKSDPNGGTSALLDEQNQLTACGRYYQSVGTDFPQGDQTIEPDT